MIRKWILFLLIILNQLILIWVISKDLVYYRLVALKLVCFHYYESMDRNFLLIDIFLTAPLYYLIFLGLYCLIFVLLLLFVEAIFFMIINFKIEIYKHFNPVSYYIYYFICNFNLLLNLGAIIFYNWLNNLRIVLKINR